MNTWQPPSPGVSLLLTLAGSPQGTDQESSANKAYIGAGAAGPTAAQLAFVGVFNPLASGVRLYIDRIRARSSAADNLSVYQTQTQVGGAGVTLRPKLGQGGAASALTMFTGTQVAAIGNSVTLDVVDAPAASAFREVQYRQFGPWICDPGNGLYLQSNTVNLSIYVILEARQY